jgi:molybdenum cofactor biosynthesis enzyme
MSPPCSGDDILAAQTGALIEAKTTIKIIAAVHSLKKQTLGSREREVRFAPDCVAKVFLRYGTQIL